MYVKGIWHGTAKNDLFKLSWSCLYQFSEILNNVTKVHAKDISGSNHKKIRTFSLDSALATKLDILIEKSVVKFVFKCVLHVFFFWYSLYFVKGY